MTAELDALAQRLGVDRQRLTPLRASAPDDIAALDAAVARAMEQEDRAFDAALEEALRFVPRLLRGPAQKLLFPGGRRG
jgi:hypothetical protein